MTASFKPLQHGRYANAGNRQISKASLQNLAEEPFRDPPIILGVKVLVVEPWIAQRNHLSFAVAHGGHHHGIALGEQLLYARRSDTQWREIDGVKFQARSEPIPV